jgi:hypothetical protein
MLPPALPNRKPHGDVSDLKRSERYPYPKHYGFAKFPDPNYFFRVRSKSNASALAHVANDLTFLSLVTDETFPPHLAYSRLLKHSRPFRLNFFWSLKLHPLKQIISQWTETHTENR